MSSHSDSDTSVYEQAQTDSPQEQSPQSPTKDTESVSQNEPNSSPSKDPENTTSELMASAQAQSDTKPPIPSRRSVQDYFHLGEPIEFPTVELSSGNLLLEYNLKKIDERFNNKSEAEQKLIEDGIGNLRALFGLLQSAISLNDNSRSIPWDQWRRLMNNELEPDQIADLLIQGVPDAIRSVVWQVISKSCNLKLNDYYLMNKLTLSMHEKQMKKDITRNSFYNSIQKYDRITELFNILKVYSEYDSEVGYNQSFIFLASPLILKLPELESFSLFTCLMKDYNLREFYDKDMKGLQLMLYKFDRLMEIYCPSLFNHLIRQGIRSNLYASQWFLTLFSYKFPIEVILVIYDFLILEGIDFLLKLALRLMILNEPILLGLQFEGLLGYLNNNILDVLVKDDFKPGEQYYDHSKIFSDLINLDPNLLNKFELEFEKLYELNEKKLDDINKLNLSNGKLRNEIKYLQLDLFNLNKEHLDIVQKLISLKVRLPELSSHNLELEDEIVNLKETLSEMKDVEVPHNIEQQIEELLVENKTETEKNIGLEDQLNELLAEESELDTQLQGLKKGWFWKRS